MSLSFWVPRNLETQWDGFIVHIINVYLEPVSRDASCYAVGYKIWPPHGDPNKYQKAPADQIGSNSSSFVLIFSSYCFSTPIIKKQYPWYFRIPRNFLPLRWICVSFTLASVWSKSPQLLFVTPIVHGHFWVSMLGAELLVPIAVSQSCSLSRPQWLLQVWG